jgi:CheY-like chemotaxis protein
MRQYEPAVFDKIKQICCQARLIFAREMENDTGRVRNKKFPLQIGDSYYELMASPVIDADGQIKQIVAVAWDATSGRRLQQKIDAIDAAGRELARIDREEVAKLEPGPRLRLLRDKIIRYSQDLLHFDHFVIRRIDRKANNKLEVIIAEGLPEEALEIDLYANPEGNGISGYVAATGRSYICHDVEKDSRYVLGLEHGKSSLTVPLRLLGEVVGVYNIESKKVGAFNEDDRQFAEIFGRYIAMTLNILDLLVAERCDVAGRLADNVVQEMREPLNDIVHEAQTLMEEYIGHDSMRDRLNRIVDHVTALRDTLRDVQAGPNAVLGRDKQPGREADPLLKGRRVLVADDEQNIRETIGDILRKRGAQVDICKDGHEAHHMLEVERYDLVITDIKMPNRNGYEIFAAARREDEHLPVILMTGFGYDPNHSIVRASTEGLNGVMFKPFKVDQLLEEVHKAMRGQASAPAK